MNIEPLRSHTMTLDELRKLTLKMIRRTVKQLRRAPHEEGMSDEEFIEYLCDFKNDILMDIEIEKMKDAEGE